MILIQSLSLSINQASHLMILIRSSILSVIQANHHIGILVTPLSTVLWSWSDHRLCLLSRRVTPWSWSGHRLCLLFKRIIPWACQPYFYLWFFDAYWSPALSALRVSYHMILTWSSIMYVIQMKHPVDISTITLSTVLWSWPDHRVCQLSRRITLWSRFDHQDFVCYPRKSSLRHVNHISVCDFLILSLLSRRITL